MKYKSFRANFLSKYFSDSEEMLRKATSRDAPSYAEHLKIDPQKDKTTEFSTNSVSSKGKFGEKKTEASRQH